MTIPSPPPSMPRVPVDTECLQNYWMLGMQLADGSVKQWRICGADSSMSEADRAEMRAYLDAYPFWTFNGNSYDIWMIAAVLAGYTCSQLKMINDKIISERVKPWQLGIPRWEPRDHIDIMEVIPGSGSQKYYAGMIHYRTMQDMPHDHNVYVTTDIARDIDDYNANDLGQLRALAEHPVTAEAIKLREFLGEMYGLDVRSKSDAQVAEAILIRQCEKALGRKIKKSEPDWNIQFKYDAPAYLQYQHPALREVLRIATTATYGLSAGGGLTLPVSLEGATVTIGASTYRLGIGGLHSSEEGAAHVAGPDELIIDVDVDSYYPSLMLNAGAWPEALGPQFLTEFAAIRKMRLDAKGEEKKHPKGSPEYEHFHAINMGMKIMINGTFGKTGSVWSALFAPKMTIQTTVTGQLLLLMLIEWCEMQGLQCISANTDGVVIKLKRKDLPLLHACIKRWEAATGLTMEANEYKSLYSQGVNSYLAVYAAKHEVKRKGEFAPTSLLLKKAPDCEICADACAAYVLDGVPVEQTIYACGDVRKFVKIQNVSGGAVKMWGDGPRKTDKVRDMIPRLEAHGWEKRGRGWHHPAAGAEPMKAAEAYALTFDPQDPELLGSRIRWYYSLSAPGPIQVASGSKKGNQVSESWSAHPLMTLPDSLPLDIDYDFYINRAKKMLRSAGVNL